MEEKRPGGRLVPFVLGLAVALVLSTGIAFAGHQSQRHIPLTDAGIPKTPNYVELTPREQFRSVTLLDLTHSIRNGIPTFFGPFDGHENVALWEDGFYANQLTMFENTGTQIDAPAHFVEGQRPLDQLSLDSLVGVAVKVDLADVVAESGDPNYAITDADILAWEEANSVEIGEGQIVLFRTGWEDLWNPFVVGEDTRFISGFPGLDASAALLLVDRGIRGWGIDTTSQDPAPSSEFPVHRIFGEADVWALENLDNLKRLPTFSFLVVGPAKIRGPDVTVDGEELAEETASGGPARVWALFQRKDTLAFAEALDAMLRPAFDDGKAFDLTHTLENGIPTFTGSYDDITQRFGYDTPAGFILTHLGTLSEHTGTHLDAPGHFAKGHPFLDQIPLGQLAGTVVVVDASGMLADNRVMASEILAWEVSAGFSIDAGEMVFFATGWGARWDDFLEGDLSYQTEDWPALTPDAAELLVARGVAGAGIDTLSIDPKPSEEFPVHHILNGADIWIAENLANMLDMGLGDSELFVTVMPWMIWHGSGAPVRIVAYELTNPGETSLTGILAVVSGEPGQGTARLAVVLRGRGPNK